MAKKKELTFRCVGVDPLVMNAIPTGLLEELAQGKKRTKARDADLQDVARDKIYLDDGGVICMPRKNIFAALKYAGKFVKVGKKNVTTSETTQLPSILSIKDAFIPINGGKPGLKAEWVMDMCAGRHRQGTSKVMVSLVRPRFDKWGFDLTLVCDDDKGAMDTVRQLVIEAGDKSGLGDFRPSSGGFYGRFRPVGKIVVADMAQEAEEALATFA